MKFNLRFKCQFLRRLSMEPGFGGKVKAGKRRQKKQKEEKQREREERKEKRETDLDTNYEVKRALTVTRKD